LDIGVLGYIGIDEHKEHSPEVWHIPPGTPCINNSVNTPWYTQMVKNELKSITVSIKNTLILVYLLSFFHLVSPEIF